MSDLARITRAAPRGMITLRGDLSSRGIKKVVKALAGGAVPPSGAIVGSPVGGAAWMSPDELLLMCPYDDVPKWLGEIAKACGSDHHLAVDVSDARAVFELRGPACHEVLARLSPVDLHEERFEVGMFRRTRVAQIAAAYWRHDDGFDVICFRSVAEYAERLLRNAAEGAATGVLE